MSANVIHPIGTGFLHLADATDPRLRAVTLKDAQGRVLGLTGIPVCTFAVLIAVRLETVYRRQWRGQGRTITTKTVETAFRLGSGHVQTVAGTKIGAAYAIGVEPDRPGHSGPWLDPDSIIKCRRALVRLELHRPADVRELPTAGAKPNGGPPWQ
jgi:hypothetical protein